MLKRILLAATFVTALGVGGLGISNSASAYGGCHYGGYYGPPVAYRSYRYEPRYYGAYYPSFYRGGYGYGGYGGYGGAYVPFGRHHHRSGVYLSFGF